MRMFLTTSFRRCSASCCISGSKLLTVPVSVTIKDRWGNPLGGHLIEVIGDDIGGTITGAPSHTDSYGVAGGFSFTATTDTNVTVSYVIANDLDIF